MPMERRKSIELLAPAKNLACGVAAIDHGADAVYIGAPRFGARAAAGNSLDDLKALADYAHRFHAKVYATVNTILYDEELAEARQLIWDLYHIGIDALIVQDMALLRMDLPPIPLHASTQMDNRTPQKVQWLRDLGFSQAVLARELGLKEISAIHAAVPDMPLEAFVHGALCVSFSGQCYASQYCFGRSANRGECAQFCRLPFSLEDADGRTLVASRHLLSLKDMNRGNALEEMLDAGVTSFKIEGRLKDEGYVKNITAWYRQQLDAIFERRPEYGRASDGIVRPTFKPNPIKSFSRGFTDYFLHGRTDDIFSFDTPKSVGEPMGRITFVGRDFLTVDSKEPFHNGDGACCLGSDGKLMGFRINRVDGNRLYPAPSPELRTANWRSLAGLMLYRNADVEFGKALERSNGVRRLLVTLTLREVPTGFTLAIALAHTAKPAATVLHFPMVKEPARTPQASNVRDQLSRLGGTLLEADEVYIDWSTDYFIPSSVLADMRRQTVEVFWRTRRICRQQPLAEFKSDNRHADTRQQQVATYSSNSYRETFRSGLTYLANVSNSEAAAFYRQQGAADVASAFELSRPHGVTLMFCKHCLRFSLGLCPKQQTTGQQRRPPRRQGQQPFDIREPLTLVSYDGRRFPLRFDCKHCVMQVFGE